MKPVLKPDNAKVAGLFAGITIGLNLVAGPASAAPIEPPPPPQYMASHQPLLLSVRRKLLAPLPEGTTQDDRDGLWMFYASRTEPVWVTEKGWTPQALAVVDGQAPPC